MTNAATPFLLALFILFTCYFPALADRECSDFDSQISVNMGCFKNDRPAIFSITAGVNTVNRQKIWFCTNQQDGQRNSEWIGDKKKPIRQYRQFSAMWTPGLQASSSSTCTTYLRFEDCDTSGCPSHSMAAIRPGTTTDRERCFLIGNISEPPLVTVCVMKR